MFTVSDIRPKYFTFYGYQFWICLSFQWFNDDIFQAVSVVGRGEPVYSASPVPVHYDTRTLQMSHAHAAAAASQSYAQGGGGSLPPTSPQLSHTYSSHPAPAPVYSQSLAQAHEMSLGAHNVYHLVRPDYLHNIPAATATSTSRTHKAIPEIFLTRLLSTKGTVQKFVDDFFGTILKVPQNFPPPVKWLFDILDDAARHNNVHNTEVRVLRIFQNCIGQACFFNWSFFKWCKESYKFHKASLPFFFIFVITFQIKSQMKRKFLSEKDSYFQLNSWN